MNELIGPNWTRIIWTIVEWPHHWSWFWFTVATLSTAIYFCGRSISRTILREENITRDSFVRETAIRNSAIEKVRDDNKEAYLAVEMLAERVAKQNEIESATQTMDKLESSFTQYKACVKNLVTNENREDFNVIPVINELLDSLETRISEAAIVLSPQLDRPDFDKPDAEVSGKPEDQGIMRPIFNPDFNVEFLSAHKKNIKSASYQDSMLRQELSTRQQELHRLMRQTDELLVERNRR